MRAGVGVCRIRRRREEDLPEHQQLVGFAATISSLTNRWRGSAETRSSPEIQRRAGSCGRLATISPMSSPTTSSTDLTPANRPPLLHSIDSQQTLALSALTGVRPMTGVYPLERLRPYDRIMSGDARLRVVLTTAN
jgi:hypothetical protein